MSFSQSKDNTFDAKDQDKKELFKTHSKYK